MADNNPFASLGLDFVRWQNAPSLTGGRAEAFLSKAKGVVAAKYAKSSGLADWLDGLTKSEPEGAAVPNQQQATQPQVAPVVPVVKAPVAPAIPGAATPVPSLVPLPTIGQANTEQDDDNLNETLWGR